MEAKLKWPPGWRRTPGYARRSGDQFSQLDPVTNRRVAITESRAHDMLRYELRKLGARNVVITADSDGVAVYFVRDGKSLAMATDRFYYTAANLRSLALAVAAMRQLERHGGAAMMSRAFSGFEALPAPRSCWDILGVDPDADPSEIERAFRVKALDRHPDRGGSNQAMAELNAARDQALQKFGVMKNGQAQE